MQGQPAHRRFEKPTCDVAVAWRWPTARKVGVGGTTVLYCCRWIGAGIAPERERGSKGERTKPTEKSEGGMTLAFTDITILGDADTCTASTTTLTTPTTPPASPEENKNWKTVGIAVGGVAGAVLIGVVVRVGINRGWVAETPRVVYHAVHFP